MIISDLASEKAFVIEEAVGVRDTGGVTFSGSTEISHCSCSERRVGGESVEEEVVQKGGKERRRAELVAQVER